MTHPAKTNSNAVTIHYWSGIYVDKNLEFALSEEHKVALRKCFENPQSVRFEKLRGHNNVFSIRHGSNKSGRILLTDLDGKLVVLALLPTHNYKKELLKLESGVLKHFKTIQRSTNEDTQLLFDDNDTDDSQTDKESFEQTNERPACLSDSKVSQGNHKKKDDNDDNDKVDPCYSVDFKKVAIEAKTGDRLKTLVLDNEQEVSVKTTGPAIISGLPGSGKTTVAMELLNEAELLPEGQTILYASQGAHLVDAAREAFRKIASKEAFSKVKFATYTELLSDCDDNSEISILQGRRAHTYVLDWLETYIKQQPKTIKAPFSAKDAEKVYQEFRIRSGYTSEEYLDIQSVGKKQSLFMTPEQRAWIDTAYSQLLSDLNAGPIRLAEFMAIPNNNTRTKYYKVLLDEAQNLSNCQLKSASELALRGHVYYLHGDGQCLKDDIPSKIYIQRLYPSPMIVQSITLKFPYRCPKSVMSIASQINDLRIELTPKNKHEQTFDSACEHIENDGDVLFSNSKKSPQTLKRIRSLVSDRLRTCVITHPSLIEEAQSLYNAKGFQVFSPEDIIGLQYEHVIIYEPFFDEAFKAIDKEMSRSAPIRNSDFAKPLSHLFVAIARSEGTVVLDSSIYRRNLISFIEEIINQAKARSKVKEAETSTQPDLEIKAHTIAEYRKIATVLKGEEQYDKLKALLLEAKSELTKNGVDEFAIAQFLSKYEPQPNARQVSTSATSSTTLRTSSNATPPKKEGKSSEDDRTVTTRVASKITPDTKSEETLAKKRQIIEEQVRLHREKNNNASKTKSPAAPLKGAQRQNKRPISKISQIAEAKKSSETVNFAYEQINKMNKNISKALQSSIDNPTAATHDNEKKLLALILKKRTNKALKQIRLKNINLNYVDQTGEYAFCPPIFLAAVTNQPSLVAALRKSRKLSYKDTIVTSGKYAGISTLSVAIKGGFDRVVKELLVDGFVNIKEEELNCVTHGGYSPLALACLNRQLKCAKLLVENGADLEMYNELGLTPLFCAVKSNHLELVQYLVQKRVDINQVQSNGEHEGETALEYAVINMLMPIAKFLIENKANTNLIIAHGFSKGATLLVEATSNSNLPMVELLLDSDADVNRIVPYGQFQGYTALTVATTGHDRIVEPLLKANANPNQFIQAGPYEGETPLVTTCTKGNDKVAKLLLDFGASVDTQQEAGPLKGMTALFAAAWNGHLSTVQLLLDAGADIDARQGPGPAYNETALYIAAANDREDVFRLLIKKGSNVNLKQGQHCVSMLPIIAGFGNPSIVQILLDAGIHVHDLSLKRLREHIDASDEVSLEFKDEIYSMIERTAQKSQPQAPAGELLNMFHAVRENSMNVAQSENEVSTKSSFHLGK